MSGMRETAFLIAVSRIALLRRGELILAYAAERALVVVRQILKARAGCNAVVGIAQRFIVHIAADVTNVFHREKLLSLQFFRKAARNPLRRACTAGR